MAGRGGSVARRGLLLVCTLLLATPAIGQGQESVEDLVRGLVNPRKRVAAYRELLGRKDPKAIPHLLKALPGAQALSQYYGVLILAAYPPKLGNPALKSLVERGNPHLRVTAGAKLLSRGDRSVGTSVADALLSDGITPAMRTVLVNRLIRVEHRAVVAALRSLLRPEEPDRLLLRVFYVLHLRKDRAAAGAAERLLKTSRTPIRPVAAAFLYRLGHEGSGKVVADAIRSGKTTYTYWVWVRLYLSTAGRASTEILDALAALLEVETNPLILTQAMRLLQVNRHPPAAASLKGHLLSEDPAVAAAAFTALLATPGALTPETLRPLLTSKQIPLRLRAADALRRYDDRSGLSVIAEIVTNGAPEDRAEAAKLLGRFRISAAVDPLLDALLDPDERVRTGAFASATTLFFCLFPYRRLNLSSAGYAVTDAPDARLAAVSLLRAWWEENRAKDW